jgi:hypothetical protein
MLDKETLEEVGAFFLMAVIVVSLLSFSEDVNEYVRTNSFSVQSASVFQAVVPPSAPKPLVSISVAPGIVDTEANIAVSWELDRDALFCLGTSDPSDLDWDGEKDVSTGMHSQQITSPSTNTTYTIECIGRDAKSSVASMEIIVE